MSQPEPELSSSPPAAVLLAFREFYRAIAVRLEKETHLMASIADLVAADAALASEVAGIKTAIDALIAAYNTAINNPATHLSAEDQTTLDAAVADVEAQTASLSTEQGTIPSTGG